MSRRAQIFSMSSSIEFEKRTSLGTRKGSCEEPFLVPGAGAAISVAIVSCQFLFKVLTDRMLGSDSVG